MEEFGRPIKVSQFKIFDPFWDKYLDLVRKTVVPYQWEAINDRIPGAPPSHSMHNFKVAAGLEEGTFEGPVFQDHDWFTWIEVVGHIIASTGRDRDLEKIADESIDVVCAAQRDDGYLNTYYILNGIEKRWTNLMYNHELFNLGHFIEGAVAYYEATGKDKIVKAAMKYTDLVCRTFGPEENRIHGYPGHELIVMALIELYGVTSEKRYLELAKYFIDERGKEPLYFCEERKKYNNAADQAFELSYFQAERPVRQQKEAIGHAVRAVYLYAGMADIARMSNDQELFAACERLWKDIIEKKMYITGSIGASPYGEAFSFAYDLPNDTAYAETCAAIGLFFFAFRMLLTNPDREYADVMERTLYNGILSGISPDGTHYFYVNPLEVIPEAVSKDHFKSHVKITRQKWFGCACCPPNVARLFASLGKYAFTPGPHDELYIHLYLGGSFTHNVKGQTVEVVVKTDYPWREHVSIGINTSAPVSFCLGLRIPGWVREYEIKINDTMYRSEPRNGYSILEREWKSGDTVSMRLAMPVTVNMANPAVREDLYQVAISLGPLIYCIEEADNGKDLHLISLGDEPNFRLEHRADLLGGVTVINADALVYKTDWQGRGLYAEATKPEYAKTRIRLIPYYAWANRGAGEMRVWIHR
jgi:DUF1680 family protein